MIPATPLLPHAPDFQGHLPGQLMDVITELTEVIHEENAVMAEGMPAAVIHTIDRKLELSDIYEELCDELRDSRPECLAADPELARKLMEAVLLLREATAENLVRLEAAMDASKRRVEAVLAAVRSEVETARPYSAEGTIPLGACLAAFGKDFHA